MASNLTNDQILKMINDAATTYGVPPQLLTRMMIEESSLNPDVGTHTVIIDGKQHTVGGIAQFLDDTASKYGVNIYDTSPDGVKTALYAAAKVLADNASHFNNGKKPDATDTSGIWNVAAAAYNTSQDNVQEALDKAKSNSGGGVFGLPTVIDAAHAIGIPGTSRNWVDFLPKETQKYVKDITGNTNPMSPAQAAGIKPSTTTSTAPQINPDGSIRMPQLTDFPITDTNGNTTYDTLSYMDAMNKYLDIQTKKSNLESGPLSKYVDDFISDLGRQIESGQLSVTKANSQLTNSLNAFKNANDVYSSDAFKYGAAPGATSLDYGNFHMPINGGITVNPLQQALDQVNQGNALLGGINIPQIPSVAQIQSGYNGAYGGTPGSGYTPPPKPPLTPNSTPEQVQQFFGINPLQAALSGGNANGLMPNSPPPPPPPPPPLVEGASSQNYNPSNYDLIARQLAGA